MDHDRVDELEKLISTLETRIDRLQREREDLAASVATTRSAAAAASRVAEVAIGRLIEVRELADTAVEWLEDPASISRSDAETKLRQLAEKYRHRRSQES
jgi:flagellar biosynthesis chaperone FliJ